MWDCEHLAGEHPLLVLTVEETLERAREIFADHSELPRLVAQGCARVSSKWESTNDDLYYARQWAIELAEEYAAWNGIALVRLENEAQEKGKTVTD